MRLTEVLFHQLIEKTEELLLILKTSMQTDGLKEVDHLFDERESLLKQLSENLIYDAEVDKLEPLYKSLQVKEAEIQNLIKTSMQKLNIKIKESRNARTFSKQYDSYLRPMTYGAFVDKKK